MSAGSTNGSVVGNGNGVVANGNGVVVKAENEEEETITGSSQVELYDDEEETPSKRVKMLHVATEKEEDGEADAEEDADELDEEFMEELV